MQQMPGLIRLTRADVREIGPRAHRAQQNRVIVQVIARHRAPISPTARDIGSKALAADLLRMTVDATLGDINRASLRGQSLERPWVNLGCAGLGLRAEFAKLQVRQDD